MSRNIDICPLLACAITRSSQNSRTRLSILLPLLKLRAMRRLIRSTLCKLQNPKPPKARDDLSTAATNAEIVYWYMRPQNELQSASMCWPVETTCKDSFRGEARKFRNFGDNNAIITNYALLRLASAASIVPSKMCARCLQISWKAVLTKSSNRQHVSKSVRAYV